MTRKRILASTAFAALLPGLAWVLVPALNHASRDVAFMGDSLTQGWAFPRENFGVYGQTTAQMLQRFQRQIPGHRAVVLLGGTNDTLLHLDPAVTLANLGSMVDLAQSDHVEPILAELPPIGRDGGAFNPAVDRLNAGIAQLAAARHLRLARYNAALRQHSEAFSDGVHLKRRGYLRLEIALLRVTNVFLPGRAFTG